VAARTLNPARFYWAKSSKYNDGETTIVQISTIFGDELDYWTLAVLGSDQHHMIADFDIIAEVTRLPEDPFLREAAE